MAYNVEHKGTNTDWGYDPTTVLICKFKDGTIGKCASILDCVMPYQFNIDIAGTKGTIRDNRVWSEAAHARPDRLGHRPQHPPRLRRRHAPPLHAARWKPSPPGSSTASRSPRTSTTP